MILTEIFGTIGSSVAVGFEAALTGENLLYCALGVTLGTFLGALPGIGVLIAMSMLFPVTFHLAPTAAIIMLGGIYYGTTYGGSIASILLNIPGTPANAVTCLDGHPMAKRGRAAFALATSALSSFFGASFGILVIMLFAPLISAYALDFGPSEYFLLMLLGLLMASSVSGGSPLKGLMMVLLGISLGLVGTDLNSGNVRYTFGIIEMRDGLGLLGIAMGLFGVTEVIASARSKARTTIRPEHIRMSAMLPRRGEVRRIWAPALRGSVIGSFVGALPGTGGMIAAFMSYGLEKKLSKTPEKFGTGKLEGIVAPESSNNASDQTAFIPTLTLGIPGSPALALILGVLMIHGITPGPTLIAEQPEMFWGLIISFWIGNILLLVLNIPLIGIWVRVLTIPYHLLFPAILFFVCVGAYSVNNSAFELWMVAGFAVLGYFMRLGRLPAAPLLLGFVLGPIMETQFRRTLIFASGDFRAFLDGPISLTLSLSCLVVIAWSVRQVYISRRIKREPPNSKAV